MPRRPELRREGSTVNDHATRELARRAGDGIEVALLWRASDDRVSVAVSDASTGSAFELVVEAGERPLDLFHHPFAYAAARGFVLVEPSCGSEVAVSAAS
jgi:hypothetical protein